MPVTQAVVAALVSHRILFYTLVSSFLLLVAVANALKNHSNFYAVAIYLSKSSRSVLVLANFAFLISLFSAHAVQRVFFGALRPSEVERLYDRLWFFVTESLLAFTIFRDEFDVGFVLMFGGLLFTKSFHWLASDRIEWMDQRPYPGPPLVFHIRMCLLFMVLGAIDVFMFVIAINSTLAHGVGGMVLFASEYGILMASATNSVSKYLLSAYDFYRAGQRGGENAPPWENKSMWLFYVELTTDFLKLTIYLVFFTIIITFYGLPLNIVRDVYITARSFISRLRALHRYQAATRNMDQRYPNATEEEMAALGDHTCIICREEMSLSGPEVAATPGHEGPNTTPKKLPCGHIFHFHCLRSWLERQQSCPTCRRTVLEPAVPQNQPTPAPVVAPPGPNPPPQDGNHAPVGQLPDAQRANDRPAGNPAGLVERLFRQAPAVPRAGPMEIPRNANNPQPANGVNTPAVVVQYHIQYQDRGQHNQTPAPTPTLQPLPRQAPPIDHLDPPTATQPEPQSDAPNPRNAAAEAALRRLNGSLGIDANSSADRAPPRPTRRTDIPRLIPLEADSLIQSENGWTDLALPAFVDIGSSTLPPTLNDSQLPPRLTEEQLSRLDGLTRESIDERLRVLEGVSATVDRCIDDLIRMRSVLPVAEAVRVPPLSENEVPGGSGTNE